MVDVLKINLNSIIKKGVEFSTPFFMRQYSVLQPIKEYVNLV